MKKCKKYIAYMLLSITLMFNVLSINVHAEGITTPSVQPDFTQVPVDTFFEDVDFRAIAQELTHDFVIYGSAFMGSVTPYEFAWNGFKAYLQDREEDTLTQHPTIGVRNTVTGQQVYDIPQEIKQEIVNFVNVEIKGNPLNYETCTISSYNFMDASVFPNYNMYQAVKNYMKTNEGYHIIQYIGTNSSGMTECRICTISHDNNLGFVGTVTNGFFGNVHLYKDWVLNYSVNGVLFRANGTSLEQTGQNVSGQLHNLNSFTQWNVFTSYEKNELVYVFQTLNAYKNYNAGLPQSYYFTSEGLEDNWTAEKGYINSNNVDNSYSYYNNVVSNVQTGWSADEVLALVDKISAQNASSNNGGGSSSDDDDDDDNWLDGLFSGLIGTIKGIITEISDGIVGIIHMVFGYDDDDGVHHDGIISNIIELLSSGFTGFLGDIFSFLPSEIVTLFTAFLTLAILFGVIKLIRGA